MIEEHTNNDIANNEMTESFNSDKEEDKKDDLINLEPEFSLGRNSIETEIRDENIVSEDMTRISSHISLAEIEMMNIDVNEMD